jgi:hypothetical protein
MAKKVKFQSTVDWTPIEKGARVEGVVIEKPFKVEKLEDRRVMLLATDHGKYRVYESFGLKEVFDGAELGDHVAIEFLGIKPLEGGHTLKLFNAQLWSE